MNWNDDKAYIIYIIFVFALMLICGLLELIAYIMKTRRESKGIYEIIDEPNKFDEGDVHMLLDVLLFFVDIFVHTGKSRRGSRSHSSRRSGGFRSSGRGGGRSGGGGGGRR